MTGRKEIALLLNATALSPDAVQIAHMQEQIASGIDWSQLLRIAIPHGVLPLVGKNLAAHAASVTPEATLIQLQRFGKMVVERNREQSMELVKLVCALSHDGFRTLPFKGPVLAQSFYGDIGLREFHDLDLWIDPSQFIQAIAWFRDAGYSPVHHVLGVAQELPAYKDNQEEFRSPDGKTIVEIKGHIEFSPASLFDPPFDEAWDRRSYTSLNGSDIATIGAEDLLPCLAAHGSKHLWRRLNWIVDVAAVMESRPAPNWDLVLARARRWRCRRRLLTAVGLARDLYGRELPPRVNRELQDSAVRSAVEHIRATLFQQKLHTFAGLTSDFIYCLRSSDSLGERLRYVLHTRNFLARALQADEDRMMLPMSGNMRRIYSAYAAIRNRLGAANLKSS